MEDRLRRNTLPADYVFDPREGRQVPGNLVLPPLPKKRVEQVAFMEGITWLIEHLLTYKADVPDISEAALKEVKKRYPDYD